MHAARTLLVGLLVMGGPAGAACCGDCDADGTPGNILDALRAAQIAAQILPPPTAPEERCACDVEPPVSDGAITVLDALVMAQAAALLPVDMRCSYGCWPAPVTPAACGTSQGPYTIPVADPGAGGVCPDFNVPDTTDFFDVTVPPGTTRVEVVVEGMSGLTDMDLYVGRAGTVPGSRGLPDYPLQSLNFGSTAERIELACAGLSSYGSSIAVAVHAFSPGSYWLTITCSSPVCTCAATPISPGAPALFNLPSASLFWFPGNPSIIGHHELTVVPPGATSIELAMFTPIPSNHDFDLGIGNPGVCGGDTFLTNYHGTSVGGGFGSPLNCEQYLIDSQELPAYGNGPVALFAWHVIQDFGCGPGPAPCNEVTLEVLVAGPGGPCAPGSAGTSPVTSCLATCYDLVTPPPPANPDCPVPDDREDRWRFVANAGQQIDVSVDVVRPEAAFDPEIALILQPTGVILADADDVMGCSVPLANGGLCPALSLSAPQTSGYIVSVKRAAPPGGTFSRNSCADVTCGEYVLSVLLDGNPASLTPLADDQPVAIPY